MATDTTLIINGVAVASFLLLAIFAFVIGYCCGRDDERDFHERRGGAV